MKNFKKLNMVESKQVNGGGKPLFYGANGYLSRDKKGGYHYTVTKGPMEAALGVMTNGLASTAGGGSWAPKW
ncbi:garvicin Q family class II bacteriocin [Vagococcus fluvialis]|uniref:garvicin Q family class II bacteriocin n=1 Tax=Vagococcus fluvialis TaxID=2738 RepID=UPI00379E7620